MASSPNNRCSRPSQSAVIVVRGLVDNALAAEMDVREVDMSVLDAGERDRGSRLCRAAAHLRSEG